MKLALRGVVDADGDIVAWPTLLAEHLDAFYTLPHLEDYRCRWRQWKAGGPVDFDPGASPEDCARVEAYVAMHR